MPENFFYSQDGKFHLNNVPFRFIGTNMYELARVDSATSEAMMKDAVSEGFQVIRFWAFHNTEKNKLEEICNTANDLNLHLIPVLADPTGYLQSFKIPQTWYKSDYKKIYLPYVKDITSSFKDRVEIFLWEIINEPVTDSFQDMFNFANHTSESIRAADPNHLISIGTIGGIGDKFGNSFSRFSLSNFEKLYSLDTLDAVSLHDYSFGSSLFERIDLLHRLKGDHKSSDIYSAVSNLINFIPEKIDRYTLNSLNKTFNFPLTLRSIWRRYNKRNLTTARKLKKPVYVGEVGFKKSLKDLRKTVLKNELMEYFNSGIAGVLLWSFESQGKSLDGHDYGFNKDDRFSEIIEEFRF